MFSLEALPDALFEKKNAPLLAGILRGVEREALRTTPSGELSQTPHPAGLGSALTHPQITTDFSEALLEFITPPTHQVDDLFAQLKAIHRYSHDQLDNEIFWPTSMPCKLGAEEDIPVALYGNSNNGQMKTVYRVGLGHRYGRAMQTVSGVHYNFSLPNAFWAYLSREQNRIDDLQDFKDEAYFNLIRNFRRHYWLLIYLFGASPALCSTFVDGKPHKLDTMSDGHTLYLPYATSLRMGDLGYQSSVQESLYVCYNNKQSYIKTLCRAITQSHPEYETIGIRNDDNSYRQLNSSILQIENEFYSAIRPKRTARPGETALAALNNRGVEYIEVRCVDVNPYSPFGITPEQVHFLDVFLTYCALQDSPETEPDESQAILKNQKKVVNEGRKPNLELDDLNGGSLSLSKWGQSLLEGMRPVAELLDSCYHSDSHQAALKNQYAALKDPSLTLSARVLGDIDSQGKGFPEFALQLAQSHREELAQPLDELTRLRMQEMAEESHAEQKAIEQASTVNFDTFLNEYYAQYNDCSCKG